MILSKIFFSFIFILLLISESSLSQDKQIKDLISRGKNDIILINGLYYTPMAKNDAEVEVGNKGIQIKGNDINTSVIKRPDNSVVNNKGKARYKHGLSFIPAGPDDSELENAVWQEYTNPKNGKNILFTIIMRGDIVIENLTIDCNMENQGLENLPKNAAEHSSMIRINPKSFNISKGKYKDRVVYIGFNKVILKDIVLLNGGYADDFWFARGYFYPGINEVIVENVNSFNRVNIKRGTICFSSAVKKLSLKNCNLYRFEIEETNSIHWISAPSLEERKQAEWKIENLQVEIFDLASSGNSILLDAVNLTATKATFLFSIDGTISNSRLHKGKNPKFYNLKNLRFENVEWSFDAKDPDDFVGLDFENRTGKGISVTLINNIFNVPDHVRKGSVIKTIVSKNTIEPTYLKIINPVFNVKNDPDELDYFSFSEYGFYEITSGNESLIKDKTSYDKKAEVKINDTNLILTK